MKKNMLALIAMVGVFVTSPVFAMEDEENSPIPAKRFAVFAVVTEQQLGCDLTLNYHVEVETRKKPRILKEKLCFEINNPEEKSASFAFSMEWNNVQDYRSDICGVYPWNSITDRSNIKHYRIEECFEGVVCIDTHTKPYYTDKTGIYYSANVYKALPRSKYLLFNSGSGSAIWDLNKQHKDFNYNSYATEREKKIMKGLSDPLSYIRTNKAFDNYEQVCKNRRNELNLLKQEALESYKK